MTTGVAALIVANAFPEHGPEIMIVALNIAVQQVADTGRSVFMAHGRMMVAGVHGTIENLVWLGVIWIRLEQGASTLDAFGFGLAVISMSSISIVALAWAFGWPLRRFRRDDVRAILRELPVFGAFSLASAASQRIDTLLIGLLLPTGAVAAAGAYYGATRLVSAFEYLPATLGRAILPDVSRALGSHDASVNRRVTAPAIEILLALSVPVPFAMILGGGWLLQVAYGPDVTAFGWIMAWLALALPFRFIGYLYGTLLVGGDAQMPRLLALLASLVALLLIDVLTLPTLGIGGAVAGLLCSSLVLFLLYDRAMSRAIGHVDRARLLVRPLLMAGVASVLALFVRSVLPVSVAAPGALVVFGIVYVMLASAYLLNAVAVRARLPADIDATP
jgi:O-antigen/teichoic acid export membrane protein